MFDDKLHKFLFRCDKCEMIVSIELDEDGDKEELEDVNENKFVHECICGGKSYVLRN